MEEADIRSAEVKKASYEFERDIVKGAVNQVLLHKIKIHISVTKDQSWDYYSLPVGSNVNLLIITLCWYCREPIKLLLRELQDILKTKSEQG